LTTPKPSFGHGYLNDCDAADPPTFYSETVVNMAVGDATPSTLHGDWLKIEAVFDGGATDEYCYYEKDITNISSDTYKKFFVRYKTSESANGAQAKVVLVFTSGTQTILDSAYSTLFTVASGDITAGKTIDKIQFWADDDGTDGTFYVYYDFLLLCAGTFTFPNVGHGLEFTPPPRYAIIPIFSRVGDITQGGGSELATVRASCDLDVGTWKRLVANGYSADDYIDAQVIDEISHNTYHEPWQWLDTGTGRQFKATLETPVFRYMPSGNKTTHILDLLFREYRLSDASNESYVERFGLNL